MTRREELEHTIEKLKEQLANVEDEMRQLTTWEDVLFDYPSLNQSYYFVDVDLKGNLTVREGKNDGKSQVRENIMYSGRGFSTRQKAEDELRRINIRAKLEKVARYGNTNKKLIMRAEGPLYYIFYNQGWERLEQQVWHMLNIPAGTIVSEDPNFLDSALRVISREDLEWFCQNEK